MTDEPCRRGAAGSVIPAGLASRRSRRGRKPSFTPLRERRAELAQRPDDVLDLLRDGTKRARRLTAETLEAVRDGLGVFTLAA